MARLKAIVFMVIALQSIIKSVDFYKEKQISIPWLYSNTSNIYVLKSTLAALSTDATSSRLLVSKGQSFEQIIRNQSYQNPVQPLLGDETIYVNKGSFIEGTRIQNSDIQLNISHNFSPTMITDQNKIIASPFLTNLPFLISIDIDSKEYKIIRYQTKTIFKQYQWGYLSEMGQNLLAYAIGNRIYIIQKTTLQKINVYINPDEKVQEYRHLDSVYDLHRNQSTILVQDQSYNNEVFIFKHESGELVKKSKFYNALFWIQLTSANSGVSIMNQKLWRWTGFEERILVTEFYGEGSDQVLYQTSVISVFNNENSFAVRKDNELFVYSLNHSDFKIKKQYSVLVQQCYYLTTNTGRNTQNDKLIFLICSNFSTESHLVKIDTDTKTSETAQNKNKTSSANCSAFQIVNDKYIVALCMEAMPSQTKPDLVEYSYEIVLFEPATLSTISSLTIKNASVPIHLKILYNAKWKNYFVVLTLINDDNCVANLYQIENQKVIDKQTTFNDISFYRSAAVENYIASMKFSAGNPQYNYLVIYSFENFGVLGKFFYPKACEKGLYQMQYEKNILIIQHNIQERKIDVYDFSLPKQNWFRGGFFNQFGSDNQMIFPNHMYWYVYNDILLASRPTKIIYNITSNPITQTIDLNPNTIRYAQYYLYIRPDKQNKSEGKQTFDSKCGIVIYIVQKVLYTFKDCQPYQKVEQIPLDPLSQFVSITPSSLDVSSDGKYFILSYKVVKKSGQRKFIQVRSLANLTQVVWHYQFLSSLQANTIDIIRDGVAVICKFYHFDFIQITQSQSAQSHQVANFLKFDMNLKGCMIFSGPTINELNKTRIIFKKTSNSTQYISQDLQVIDSNISILHLDSQCNYFATYDSKDNVRVWKINSDSFTQIFSQKFTGTTSIKLSQKKVAIEWSGGLAIHDFYKNGNSLQISPLQQIVSNFKCAFSQDGKLLACRDSDLRVKIIDLKDTQQISYFNTSSNITGLTFTDNNRLWVSLADNKLYILSISNRFCPENQVFIQTKCQNCNFVCQTCQNTTSSCLKFSVAFYLLLSGGIVVLVALIVVISCFVVRYRRKKVKEQQQQLITSEGIASTELDKE